MKELIKEVVFDGSNKEIYSDTANKVATLILPKGNKNNSTQLRKFYDEIVKWNNRIQHKPSEKDRNMEFDICLADIKKLKSQAAYAFSRELIDDNYLTLFNHCIDSITSSKNLREVKSFMEATMGYYKYHEKLKEIEQHKQRYNQNKNYTHKSNNQHKRGY